jgi:hypothetical protein
MWQIDDLPPLRCTRSCDKHYFCFPNQKQEQAAHLYATNLRQCCRTEARVGIFLGVTVLLLIVLSLCTL